MYPFFLLLLHSFGFLVRKAEGLFTNVVIGVVTKKIQVKENVIIKR